MSHGRKVSVTGLGYVGLPLAVALAEHGPVVAYDASAARIAELREGKDRTREVESERLRAASLALTDDPAALAAADFHIVAVPTPVDTARMPDLTALRAASRAVGAQLKRGDIVVYESTVYPGVTEEVCAPLLEEASGLRAGVDFHLGYSPERANPGDTRHRLADVVKVVAGQDAATLETVAAVYGEVVAAGVHRASSIRVAEAAKVIENVQRDLNIALVNELARIFSVMGLPTHEVLAAARTKWNFLPFEPGLVGGHCIGVDPYYLTYKAQQAGYHPELILAGRRINDGMSRFLASEVIKRLVRDGDLTSSTRRITVLGLTFKENVPDLRNTRVVDVVHELQAFGFNVQVHDPLADPAEAQEEYGLSLQPLEALAPADAVVITVAHRAFREAGWPLIARLLAGEAGLVVDVKGALEDTPPPDGPVYWRL